ncbi:MAG: RimK/LysX family protein, partial [Marinobacter sp.]
MYSKRLRAGLSTFSIMVIAGTVLLTGCSADRYFMVPKSDLSDLNASSQSQRATLVAMENNATVRHETILRQNEAVTQKVLNAITTQVAKPSCPPMPAQKACPASEKTQGRADRLKGKVVVGEVENFYLAGPELVYKARIDSGAETSSIDARKITRFERDGSNWVRFDVPVPGTEDFVTL